MADKFVDLAGLGYFKDKQDTANDEKYVKLVSLDDIINNRLTNVYRYRGSVESKALLPTQGNTIGDVYDVAGGMNYAWNGTRWDELGDQMIEVDAALSATSSNPVQNKAVKAALDAKAGTSIFGRSSDGLVPHPTTSTTTRYLREDGSWQVPPDNNTTYTAISNTEIDSLFK